LGQWEVLEQEFGGASCEAEALSAGDFSELTV
jgi:hypothetical protein